MKFEIAILGSSSATPVFNRNPSAQLLNCNDNFYLIDCGEGTQQQLIKFGYKASKIDHVFITHLHGDHYFGLIGLISSLHLNGRTKALNVYGPKALEDILNIQFKYSDTVLKFPLIFNPIDGSRHSVILENKDLIVEAFPLNHRIPCTGFVFKETPHSRKLNVSELEAKAVPLNFYSMLKRGVDVTDLDGKVYKYSDFTFPPLPPRKYAYCSDTIFEETYFSYIKDSDLLYHEATFMHDLVDRAKQTFHTTSYEAALVAQKTNSKRLLIGHFSSRYKTLIPLLMEAKTVFETTELAIEGRTFQI